MHIFWLALAICLLPSSTAQAFRFPNISGWKLSGDVQTFGPKTLYEHINGAADLYLAADFEELKVAEYIDEKKASVIVEVYRHRTPRDAFGIYSQERLPEGNFLTIGAQGYIDREVLNFVQGRYYVKLGSFNTGPRDAELLQAIAKQVAVNLGEGGRLPAILSAFPAEGKKSHSEKYITRNFLGYPFFNSAYTADYEIAGRAFKLFLIEAADKQACRIIMEQYLRLTKTPVRELSEGRHRVSDPHHGVIDLFWKEAYIWGTVDLADADLRSKVLQSLEKNIMPAKRAPE
ncbi:MAG: DUF6599 family protein [Thermodesulfobacteriota bacterium]